MGNFMGSVPVFFSKKSVRKYFRFSKICFEKQVNPNFQWLLSFDSFLNTNFPLFYLNMSVVNSYIKCICFSIQEVKGFSFKEIKTPRTDFSFEFQLWVQVSGVYVLIMAVNMPAPATASGALVNADGDRSVCHK